MKLRPQKKREQTTERTPGKTINLSERISYKLKSIRNMLTQWLSLALLIILIVVPTSLFIWLFFFTETFNVQAVSVVDARDKTTAQVKQIINEQVEGGPLGKNIFFVQTESLEQAIKTKLSQIKTIHIVRKLPATIKAIVQEKEPAILLLSGGKYYFVDKNGVAYERARLDTLPGKVLTTVKNDDQQTKVTIGVVTVQPNLIGFLQKANEEIPAMINARIGEVHIPSLAAREVRVILDNNWTIYFDLTRPPENQIKILKTLLEKTITEEEKETMQYIDLRVPKRIYYKTSSNAVEPQ